MDLQRILEDEEIRMNVPIHFLNEETAPGVKQGGGKVSHLMSDVEVVCLPRYLPEYLAVDVGDLELDEMLYISDIPLPEGVSIPALAQGEEANQPIVSIHVIKEVVIEEEEGLEAAAPGAVPVAGEEPEEEEGSEDDESSEG
jgi:large subunit ribosomal protein L25